MWVLKWFPSFQGLDVQVLELTVVKEWRKSETNRNMTFKASTQHLRTHFVCFQCHKDLVNSPWFSFLMTSLPQLFHLLPPREQFQCLFPVTGGKEFLFYWQWHLAPIFSQCLLTPTNPTINSEPREKAPNKAYWGWEGSARRVIYLSVKSCYYFSISL